MSFPFGQIVPDIVSGEGYAEVTIPNNIDRVGIQTNPGNTFKINDEVFYMGRSGLFEIEMPITSIDIQKGKSFIIDYHIGGGQA